MNVRLKAIALKKEALTNFPMVPHEIFELDPEEAERMRALENKKIKAAHRHDHGNDTQGGDDDNNEEEGDEDDSGGNAKELQVVFADYMKAASIVELDDY